MAPLAEFQRIVKLAQFEEMAKRGPQGFRFRTFLLTRVWTNHKDVMLRIPTAYVIWHLIQLLGRDLTKLVQSYLR
jgi:hypothetical protein